MSLPSFQSRCGELTLESAPQFIRVKISCALEILISVAGIDTVITSARIPWLYPSSGVIEMHRCEVGDTFLFTGRDHAVLHHPSTARGE